MLDFEFDVDVFLSWNEDCVQCENVVPRQVALNVRGALTESFVLDAAVDATDDAFSQSFVNRVLTQVVGGTHSYLQLPLASLWFCSECS